MQNELKNIEKLKPWEFLKKYCFPWLGAEVDYPDLFGKYGMTYCGIVDKWCWYSEKDARVLNDTNWDKSRTYCKVTDVTFEEAYKMVALTTAYWQPMHNKQSKEYQEYERLDMIRRLFMRHPEQRAEYFKECPDEKDVYYKRFPEEKELYETE